MGGIEGVRGTFPSAGPSCGEDNGSLGDGNEATRLARGVKRETSAEVTLWECARPVGLKAEEEESCWRSPGPKDLVLRNLRCGEVAEIAV